MAKSTRQEKRLMNICVADALKSGEIRWANWEEMIWKRTGKLPAHADTFAKAVVLYKRSRNANG